MSTSNNHVYRPIFIINSLGFLEAEVLLAKRISPHPPVQYALLLLALSDNLCMQSKQIHVRINLITDVLHTVQDDRARIGGCSSSTFCHKIPHSKVN